MISSCGDNWDSSHVHAYVLFPLSLNCTLLTHFTFVRSDPLRMLCLCPKTPMLAIIMSQATGHRH